MTDTIAAVIMAIVLAAATGAFGFVAYQGWVASNTWTYTYSVSVEPNGTAPGTIIIPIPRDESLLRNLHVVSGHVNWSVVDAVHGRGLRVDFADSTRLEAFFSEFSALGPSRSTRLSMMNDSSQPGPLLVWVFLDGDAGTTLDLLAGGISVAQPLTPGWELYELVLPPVP